MKICQIMLCKGFGGAERAFVDTCIELKKYGHSVMALIENNSLSENELKNNDIPYESLNIIFRQNPFIKRTIAKHMNLFQPDLIHLHLRRSIQIASPVIKKSSFPMIVTAHNYNSLKTYTCADYIIALTNEHKKEIISVEPSLIKKTAVIPNFSRFYPKKSLLKDKPIRFLSYGRFVYKKGFDNLIKAFRKLYEINQNVELTLVGSGPLQKELTQLVTSLNLTHQIKILPWSHSIIELLDNHDVFVLPSRSEPFGIVLLEAMARGKLIITTNSEGPRQFLNKNTALFCNIDDIAGLAEQMISVSNNLTLFQSIADNANNLYIKKYHSDRVLPKLISFYQKAIDGK